MVGAVNLRVLGLIWFGHLQQLRALNLKVGSGSGSRKWSGLFAASSFLIRKCVLTRVVSGNQLFVVAIQNQMGIFEVMIFYEGIFFLL